MWISAMAQRAEDNFFFVSSTSRVCVSAVSFSVSRRAISRLNNSAPRSNQATLSDPPSGLSCASQRYRSSAPSCCPSGSSSTASRKSARAESGLPSSRFMLARRVSACVVETAAASLSWARDDVSAACAGGRASSARPWLRSSSAWVRSA